MRLIESHLVKMGMTESLLRKNALSSGGQARRGGRAVDFYENRLVWK